MRSSVVALAIVFVALCACNGGSVQDGGADATSDAVRPEEMQLAGTWQSSQPWAAGSGMTLRFTLTIRTDHSSTQVMETVVDGCGVTNTYTMQRRWQIEGSNITFAASNPTCMRQDSTTCTWPGGPVTCDGPNMGGTFGFAVNATTLTLTDPNHAAAEAAMYSRQ
jgi:hypothetical protein